MHPPRYLFIDALRGVACLAVLSHHLLYYTPLEGALRAILPGLCLWLAAFGKYGVQVFFVLSGFVIAHATRELPPRHSAVCNFILRRQIRLDPPYWVALGLVLASLALEKCIPGTRSAPFPSVYVLLLNLTYLQGIAGLQPLLSVAWTLGIEIQFYLVWAALLVALKNRENQPHGWAGPALLGSGLLSLLCVTAPQMLFVRHWVYFALGALLYWVHRGWLSSLFPALLCCACLVSAAVNGFPGDLTGGATGLLLHACQLCNRWGTWGEQRAYQYFGQISYSLYLCHATVLLAVMRLGYKLTREASLPAVIWAGLAAVASVGVAHLFWLWVERPSMEWARRLKRHG